MMVGSTLMASKENNRYGFSASELWRRYVRKWCHTHTFASQSYTSRKSVESVDTIQSKMIFWVTCFTSVMQSDWLPGSRQTQCRTRAYGCKKNLSRSSETELAHNILLLCKKNLSGFSETELAHNRTTQQHAPDTSPIGRSVDLWGGIACIPTSHPGLLIMITYLMILTVYLSAYLRLLGTYITDAEEEETTSISLYIVLRLALSKLSLLRSSTCTCLCF